MQPEFAIPQRLVTDAYEPDHPLEAVKQRIVAEIGPYLFHGCAVEDVESIFAHGLDPARSRKKIDSSAIWVATREIADRYAVERSTGRPDAVAEVAVDLRAIDARRLRADEDLIFRLYEERGRAQARERCLAEGIDAEEIDDAVEESYIDEVWEIFEAEVADQEAWSRDPGNIWRSVSETGNLMIVGTLPPRVLRRASEI